MSSDCQDKGLLMEKECQKLIKLLSLDQGQMLGIIFDKFGFDIAHWVAETATKYGINFTARYVPMLSQLYYSRSGVIPLDLKESLYQYDALIISVSDHEDCTPFRAALINKRNPRSKVLHLPGVNWVMFNDYIKDCNPELLRKEAFRIRRELVDAREIEIYTQDIENTVHKLTIKLSQERKIYCETGSPEPGEIAQIPAGEVYAAPLENLSNGYIVINGSAPERVFRKDDYVVLRFIDGLVSLEESIFSNSLNARRFREELTIYKKHHNNNMVLGEFGIGINTTINRLTGSPIHDEKADGTIHIALGCNTPFGGEIDYGGHIDLILIPARLVIDGKEMKRNWGFIGTK